jgi:hypothetical protein
MSFLAYFSILHRLKCKTSGSIPFQGAGHNCYCDGAHAIEDLGREVAGGNQNEANQRLRHANGTGGYIAIVDEGGFRESDQRRARSEL